MASLPEGEPPYGKGYYTVRGAAKLWPYAEPLLSAAALLTEESREFVVVDAADNSNPQAGSRFTLTYQMRTAEPDYDCEMARGNFRAVFKIDNPSTNYLPSKPIPPGDSDRVVEVRGRQAMMRGRVDPSPTKDAPYPDEVECDEVAGWRARLLTWADVMPDGNTVHAEFEVGRDYWTEGELIDTVEALVEAHG